MFYTTTNRPKVIAQPKCNKMMPVYKEKTDKDGKVNLIKVKEINIYEKIQENRNTNNIKDMLDRYGIKVEDSINEINQILNGDIYDLTMAPKNMIDAYNQINEAKSIFNNSSKELKQAFGNSFTDFLAAADNGNLKKIIKSFEKPKNDDILPGQMNIEEITKINKEITERQKKLEELQKKEINYDTI